MTLKKYLLVGLLSTSAGSIGVGMISNYLHDPLVNPHSLIEILEEAEKMSQWRYVPVSGSYDAYSSQEEGSKLTLAHYGIPRGHSDYESHDLWYNQLRNQILRGFPIFGKRDEISLKFLEATGTKVEVSTYFTTDPRAKELFKRIQNVHHNKKFPRKKLQ